MFITCKESRIENNRSFYGCFSLGPFDSGESLTIANALRRTLLSDCTGLGIVSVSIDNVTHEYSTIPGMRESVLDLILNLKEIVLKKKNTNVNLYKNNSSIYKQIGSSYFKPVSGFLKVKGPGVIRAKDLKLPPFICCVDPEQYIATLAEDGFLSMKFIIMEGKGYLLQTQMKNVSSTSYKLSKNINKNSTFSSVSVGAGGVEGTTLTEGNMDISSSSFKVGKEGKSYSKKRLSILKEIKKNVSSSPIRNPLDLSIATFGAIDCSPSEGTNSAGTDSAGTEGVKQKSDYKIKKNSQVDKLLEEKITFFEDKKPSILKKEIKKNDNLFDANKNENNYNTYLNLDTVFNPITKVSYIIEDSNNKLVNELNQNVNFTNEISALIESNMVLKKQLPFLTHEISLNQNDIYQFVNSCSISEINNISNFLHPVKRKTLQHNIVLEIWTNGSLHPRDALYGAFNKLSSAFLNMQKTKYYNPIYINESSLLLD
jgi:DNA-directed RNA polymerase alpha subunit